MDRGPDGLPGPPALGRARSPHSHPDLYPYDHIHPYLYPHPYRDTYGYSYPHAYP